MTLSPDAMRTLIPALLLIHGLGHGGAIGALLWIRFNPGTPTGGWLSARSWILSGLDASTATTVAMTFWTISLVGFVIAALAFLGLVIPEVASRPLAVGSALVSLAGILLFFGTWPVFNTVAALAVNTGVLVAVLVARWPATTA
jgi:hypothetical protein